MHEGHRHRLAGKILGGGVIYEHELMEILLFYSCPRRDLNAEAHSLINSFGGIGGVLSANADDLVSVDGVGESMAEYLVCLGKILNRLGGCNSFAVLRNTEQFKKFLMLRPRPQADVVEFYMVDKDGRVRRMCAEPAESRGAPVSDGKILKMLSVYKPYGLFVAERRACGDGGPTTRSDGFSVRINDVVRMCGARFYDYCIVAESGRIFSYKMADRTVFAAPFTGENYGQ